MYLRRQCADKPGGELRLRRREPELLIELFHGRQQRRVRAGEVAGARDVEQPRVRVLVDAPALEQERRAVRQPDVHRSVPVAVAVYRGARLDHAERRRGLADRQRAIEERGR